MGIPDWKSFERLVTLLEEALKKDENVTVKHNVRIKDKSNVLRQVDILIQYNIDSRFNLITIIECKDYDRKVSINAVEAFHSKAESLDAYGKILVSKNGFTEGGNKKAKELNIRLYCLQDINEKEVIKWIHLDNVFRLILSFKLLKQHLTIDESDLSIIQNKEIKEYIFYDKKADEKKTLSKLSEQLINRNKIHYWQLITSLIDTKGIDWVLNQPVNVELNYNLSKAELFLLVGDLNVKVKHIQIIISLITFTKQLTDIQLSRYFCEDGQKETSEIVTISISDINKNPSALKIIKTHDFNDIRDLKFYYDDGQYHKIDIKPLGLIKPTE